MVNSCVRVMCVNAIVHGWAYRRVVVEYAKRAGVVTDSDVCHPFIHSSIHPSCIRLSAVHEAYYNGAVLWYGMLCDACYIGILIYHKSYQPEFL